MSLLRNTEQLYGININSWEVIIDELLWSYYLVVNTE